MSKRPIILCDVDGILVDFTKSYLSLLHADTGRLHAEHEIHSFDYAESIASKEEDARIWKQIAAKTGFVYNLPVYDGALDFLVQLRDLGRVVACTSPAGAVWTAERYDWLLQVAGFDKNDIVVTRAKGLVHGDFLIDDAHHNILDWEASALGDERLGVLFDRPWNAKYSHHTRAGDYAEVLRTLSDCVA